MLLTYGEEKKLVPLFRNNARLNNSSRIMYNIVMRVPSLSLLVSEIPEIIHPFFILRHIIMNMSAITSIHNSFNNA
jgi:hypothetical protein